MTDERANRLIDAFTAAIDTMQPSDLEVLFRFYALDALRPSSLKGLPETVNLTHPPKLLADSRTLNYLMKRAVEGGLSVGFVVQGLACTITDIFRAIYEEDEGRADASRVDKLRAKLNHDEVRGKMAPFIRNESLLELRDSING